MKITVDEGQHKYVLNHMERIRWKVIDYKREIGTAKETVSNEELKVILAIMEAILNDIQEELVAIREYIEGWKK